MVTVRCFGGATAIDEAGAEITLRSRKHTGLFLYLAAHARTTHSREELADLLWEGAGRRERHSLSQALYDIRSHAGRVMEVTTKTIRLIPERVRYEMDAFEHAVGAGDHDAALELYRGEFAPNLLNIGVEEFDRWLDAERERSRVLAAIALRNAQRAAEERGDWDQMALAALRLIKQNEFDEEAHCALMRGLWMKGDPASALAHYRSLSEAMRGSPPLEELVKTIKRSGSVRETLSLPAPQVRLVGLDTAFGRLAALLRSPGHTRVGAVAISGESGTGKSALLRQFSRLVETRGVPVEWGMAMPQELRVGQESPTSLWVVDENLDLGMIRRLLDRDSSPGRLVLFSTRDRPTDAEFRHPEVTLDVIHLERLSQAATRSLVVNTYPKLSSAVTAQCASASGGNAGVALELARVWMGSRMDGAVGGLGNHLEQKGLAGSAWLRRWVESTLVQLDQDARAAAELLAVLNSTAADVASCITRTERWVGPFGKLRTHGLLLEEGPSVRLAIPFLAHALRNRLSRERALELQLEFGRVASTGQPIHRYAGAVQVHEAGSLREAESMANDAMGAALKLSDRETAARAASFLWDSAHLQKDRTAAGLMAAEAEIDRGGVTAAETLLSQLALCSSDPSVQVAVQVGLLRVSLLRRDHQAARAQTTVLSTLRPTIRGPVGDRADLQLAVTRLAVSGVSSDGSGALEAADDLAAVLTRTAPQAQTLGRVWLDGVQALVWHVANTQSRSLAVRVLKRYAAELARIPREGNSSLRLLHAFLEVRGAGLRVARGLLTSVLQSDPTPADRRISAAMNNLAVVSLESGDFDTAYDWLERTRLVDEELGLPPVHQTSTIINHALHLFFVGDSESSMKCCDDVLRETPEQTTGSQIAQALAIKGLCRFRLGDRKGAHAIAEHLEGVPIGGLYGDDQYTVHWFGALEAIHRFGRNPADALLGAAEESEGFDELNALKLRILASRVAGVEPADHAIVEARGRLRNAGAGWFDRFVQAYGRAVLSPQRG